MLFSGGFTYANFFLDVFTFFAFVIWFWLLITVFRDLFRRSDLSGWGTAVWVLFLIVAPYLGVFAYLISQGKGMDERKVARSQQARDELRGVIGFSIADEIEKLDRLRKSGSLTEEEYARLHASLVLTG
jgi:hypothetical protein